MAQAVASLRLSTTTPEQRRKLVARVPLPRMHGEIREQRLGLVGGHEKPQNFGPAAGGQWDAIARADFCCASATRRR